MGKSLEVISTEQNNDFAAILQIIEQNRSQAIQAVNHASLLTAWEVGAYVSNKIENADWGAKVVQQLAEYIHTQNPTLKGWSRRTIYKMVQFYETYSSIPFIERATSLKLLSADNQIVPPGVAQLDTKQIASTSLAQTTHIIVPPERKLC